MFEIGQTLKEARVSSGVSLAEASKDLNIKEVILENIEEGSMGCFKDIYELKDYIASYAKYLGLNVTALIDDFNEYLFEYTSKIPLKEIEKKVEEQNKEKTTEKVVSPYTKISNDNSKKKIIIGIIAFIIIVIGIVFVVNFTNKDLEKDNITYAIGR